MRIKIVRLGSGSREVELPTGSTVQDACRAAGFEPTGFSFTVDGIDASISMGVSNGAVLMASPKVEGGI